MSASWHSYATNLETDPRVLLFGTCYVDSDARVKLTRQWLQLMLWLNGDCDIWLIDSKSPLPVQRNMYVHYFTFPDNIGHLSRANVTPGRDGWGRAFCKGLELAKDHDFAVHIEADSLFRLPVMPICRQMREQNIKVASIPVQSGFRGELPNWVETGLMFWDCRYVEASNFVARYDWPHRTRLPTPEVVIRKLLGADLTMMPWKGLRQDKLPTVTAKNIAQSGYDWITHFHNDGAAYDKFIEAIPAQAQSRLRT